MARLSVIMIVKNESGCLAECLESVRPIADELVVADTGSTDETRAIAASFGARVFDVPWEEDFARARNAAIAAATGDWLLHMDADEVLDPEGARRIRELVDTPDAEADAVELVLANYCDDPRAWRWTPVDPNNPCARGHAGYIRVGLLRLFRSGMGFEYREPVHENITESVVERGGRIVQTDILIHHYGYVPSAAGGRAKAQRYLEIARRKARERSLDPKALHDLAEQAVACGLAEEAEQACRRALALAPDHLAAATTLANILLNRGELESARTVLQSLDQGKGAPPHVATALGAIAERQGRLTDARAYLDAVLESAPDTVMAHLYLARVLEREGDPQGALARLQRGLAVAPGVGEFAARIAALEHRIAGEACAREQRWDDAARELAASLQHDPESALTYNDLGVVCHAMGLTGQARRHFERALRLAPGMPEALENLRGLDAVQPG